MNKQKTDWEKTFDKTFLNIRFDTTVGTSVNIKDFISQLLKTQREEFITQLLSTQKKQLIKEIKKSIEFARVEIQTPIGDFDSISEFILRERLKQI